MSNQKKFYKRSVPIIIMLYMMFAFMEMSFNPSNWNVESKAFMIASQVTALVFIGMTIYTQKES